MATTVWNIKLIGGLTEQDFERWITAANVPTGYHFSVDDTDDASGDYWTPKNEGTISPILIPDQDDTIVISGVTDDFMYTATCFPGHRCSMSVGTDDFANGTEVFALILNSDGLLGRDLLNKLFDTVDLGVWIKKNQPSAVRAYNNADTLMDETGTIIENFEEGEILKNAICQYVVSVLAIWKNATTSPSAITATAMNLMSVPPVKPIRKTW